MLQQEYQEKLGNLSAHLKQASHWDIETNIASLLPKYATRNLMLEANSKCRVSNLSTPQRSM